MDISISGIEQYMEVLKLLAKVYQHEQTTLEVKDMIELQLRRIYGKNYDIKDLLNTKYD